MIILADGNATAVSKHGQLTIMVNLYGFFSNERKKKRAKKNESKIQPYGNLSDKYLLRWSFSYGKTISFSRSI